MKSTTCEMCNRSLDNDFAMLSLAARECILKLSANPPETMEMLRSNQFCRWKDNPVKMTSLLVLKDIYSSIKEDVRKLIDSPEPLNKESVICFLMDSHRNKHDFFQDIICGSIAGQKSSWRSLNVHSPRNKNLKQDVPSSVPPLDPDEVNGCTEWVTSRLKSARKVALSNGLKLSEIALSAGESTDSSTSSGATVIEEEQFHKLAGTVLDERFQCPSIKNTSGLKALDQSLNEKKVLLMDRSCGRTPRSSRTPRKGKVILQNSVGVQTAFEEEVLKEKNGWELRSNLESLSSSKTTESSFTTNSIIYSDLSAGQLPLRKAVSLLQSERKSLVSANLNGNVSRTKCVYGTSNIIMDDNSSYESYGIALVDTSEKDSSGSSGTTSRIPRVFDVKENDIFEVNSNRKNADFTTPLINNKNNDLSSALFVAPEISMITSFESSSFTNMLQSGCEEYYQRVVLRESASSFIMNDSRKQDISNGRSKSSDGFREIVEEEIIELIKNTSVSNSSFTRSAVISSKVNNMMPIESTKKSSKDEEEEESTLNQISPIPTTG